MLLNKSVEVATHTENSYS